MPKQTFFNLPEEKRGRIIDIALDEFADQPYGKASLSDIVAKAGIAKGSMYQYFDDKKDLYMYLLDLAVNEKLAFLNREIGQMKEAKQWDFYEAYRQTIVASMRFSLENPRLNKMVANALGPFADDILRELTERWRPATLEFYRDMLAQGQAQGDVRNDIDIMLASNFLYSVGLGLADYMLYNLGLSVQELAANPEIVRRFTEEKLLSVIGDLMKLLRNGLTAEG